MAIDTRAHVYCNLGEVIDASISDDYVQNNGLIKVSGNCQLNGILIPPPGTIVSFSYVKNNRTYQVPRTLRVLGSFADPYRNITQVQLGCKLTYLQGLVPIPELNNESDKETGRRQWCVNGYYDYPSNFNKGPFPISAQLLMDRCLNALEISANQNPLQSFFEDDSFDLSPGYVQVLSDLLLSENYCGYLDSQERLIVFSLDQGLDSTTRVLDDSRLIDIGPLNFGELPAENVFVRYNTTRLKEQKDEENENPIEEQKRNWERTETVASPVIYPVRYSEKFPYGDGFIFFHRTHITTHATTKTSTTRYGTDQSFRDDQCITISSGGEGADLSDKPIVVTETESVCLAEAAPNYCSAWLSLLGPGYFDPSVSAEITTITEYEYDRRGEMIRSVKSVYEPFFKFAGGLNLDFIYTRAGLKLGSDPVLVEREIIDREVIYARAPRYVYLREGESFEPAVGGEKIVRDLYVNWTRTPSGQQGVAHAREFVPFGSADEAVAWLRKISRSMVYSDGEIRVHRNRTVVGGQIRPPKQLRINTAQNAGPPDVEKIENIEFVYSPTPTGAGRFLEFSIPYPPDDFYSPNGLIIRSRAQEVARRFGRIQNKLLHGNRNGMNIQTVPEYLPQNPFDSFAISVRGSMAAYRINGMTWTMDSNGIVVGVDALLWGGVGP